MTLPVFIVVSLKNSYMVAENKSLYWIPVLGIFVSLINYDKENGMGMGWNYYQAFSIMAFIAITTFFAR